MNKYYAFAKAYLLAALCVAVCSPLWAMQRADRLCDAAAIAAARQSQAPLEVLQAISRVESGRALNGESTPWPWTVNYSGKGYWFETEAEAYDFAQSLLDRGENNFDVGCFQINQRWHGSKFSSLKEALSPQANAQVASDYLQELFLERGSWGDAVAAYHSKTQATGQSYLVKVEAMLQKLRTGGQLEAAQYAPAPAANNFPYLQQGAITVGASLVPQTSNPRPLFTVAP